jgi:hypothetical protein
MNFIPSDSTSKNQLLLIRIFAVFFLICWLLRLFYQEGFGSLSESPFLYLSTDRILWFLDLSGFLNLIKNSTILSLWLDISLVILPFLILIFPLNRTISISYLIIISCYLLYYNASATHFEHRLVGVFLIAFLSCFKKPERFNLIFSFSRLYTCFIFVSAAFWKLSRASVWNEDQMTNILLQQHGNELLGQEPAFFNLQIWLIEHPSISNGLWLGAFMLELSFLVGFFTRKFDYVLLVLFFVFLLMDLIIMKINFLEMGILSVFFLRSFQTKNISRIDN